MSLGLILRMNVTRLIHRSTTAEQDQAVQGHANVNKAVGLVHTMPDKFENATLRAKTEQMICVHTGAF